MSGKNQDEKARKELDRKAKAGARLNGELCPQEGELVLFATVLIKWPSLAPTYW